MVTPPSKHAVESTARIETFSDGVVAIIVTILILEITVPHLDALTNTAALQALGELWPKFLGFALSFITVAIFWVNHHHFFHPITHSDRGLLWYNNLFLFFLSLIPFGTAFLGDYYNIPIVVALYGFILTGAGGAFALMGRHVFFCSTLIPAEMVSQESRQQEFRRAIIGTAVYAVSIPLAFASVWLAIGIFIALPLYYFLPRKLT